MQPTNTYSQTRQERARALLAKYGLTLDDHKWARRTHEPVQRVEKPIKMRIRRQCHHCQRAFGAEKKCSSCEHTLCRKCTRTPPEKQKEGTPSNPAVSDRQERAHALFAKYGLILEEHEWIRPPRESVQRVEKPIRMRVRRQCHHCKKIFGAEKTCTSCEHSRCRKCPRIPSKKYKVETAGPERQERGRRLFAKYGLTIEDHEWGQAPHETVQRVEKKVRMRVRYQCHHCQTLFGSDKACSNCEHKICKRCPRTPKPKIETEPTTNTGAGGIVDKGKETIDPSSSTPSKAVEYIHKMPTQRARRT